MKLPLVIIAWISFCVVLTYAYDESNPKHTEKPIEKQLIPHRLTLDIMELFFKQPKYTRSSIKCFLKHTYNNTRYAQNFLSLNFSHITTLTSYTDQSPLPRNYISRVFGLFAQKLKSTIYINSYVFNDFLASIVMPLKPYFDSQEEKKAKIEIIKDRLYAYLEHNYSTLKEDPESALRKLAQDIYEVLFEKHNPQTDDISITDLQHSLAHFLEISLSRLIWSPVDQEQVWESVKAIAAHLGQLHANHMLLDTEVLDELLWSLLYRFCYFLELAGNELSRECYLKIHRDLTSYGEQIPFLLLKERETFITTKLDYLKHCMVTSEIKARAYQEGIIADMING
jgi:hypothetical protein